mmetsp:Transcript_8666/g.18095  ORF Transcript_8666/g.18095 Transcript_8666/m.18095 type:complete len:202 (+) Transcript_8666:253-858(+)
MVYWVIANIEPMPAISAKNFFHLCSESSHSSGITSVAPTYTKVPATIASMIASTIGAANSLTAMPMATPIGPMALKIDKKVSICPFGMPDFKNATRRAIDSAGWCKAMEMVNIAESVKLSESPSATISKMLWTASAASRITAERPVFLTAASPPFAFWLFLPTAFVSMLSCACSISCMISWASKATFSTKKINRYPLRTSM